MIIEHTTIKIHSRTHHIDARDRKDPKGIEGKKVINQVSYNSLTQKHTKSRNQTPVNCDRPDSDTYRELLSKRERNRENQSKMEHKLKKADDNRSHKNIDAHNKSYSKSKERSKSKGIVKSKSLKQLGKKSKSMVRLEVKQTRQRKQHHHIQNITKEERKSQSPHKHVKSTMSFLEKKNLKSTIQTKSNYVSKTNRQFTSELTTDRQKSKGKLKTSQISKPSKKAQKPKDFKKKSAPKIANQKKKTIQKQNKPDKKLKQSIKLKKEKKVVMSQQNSKFKRNDEQQLDNSQNEDQFLDPKQRRDLKQKKTKSKQSNMVQIPKRKERLSLNTNSKRYLKVKNSKTEAEAQVEKQRMKDLQQWAAITIQKVFRGYLTRKYIRECFQHNAAINIQRVWRGFMTRKRLAKQFNNLEHGQLQLEKQKKIVNNSRVPKILQHEQYLLQKSSSRENSLCNSNMYAQKWASILQEILSEQSVNNDIKKKIELFLERQRKQMNEFDYRSNRSSSAKSNISNQVINNEINSEKHFMENFIQQEKLKKQYPKMNVYISPTNYKSPKRFGYNSPQGYLMNSPTCYLPQRLDESQQLTSSQMLIANLKNIQKFHKERLQNKAKDDKEELNKMLIKNNLTPRTHEKKYKQVDQALESQLQKFNDSINEIVKNCILYKESPNASHDYNKYKSKRSYEQFMDFNDDSMITPKKQLVQLQLPFQMPEQCIHSQKWVQHDSGIQANMKKIQEKSQQLCDYYKFHKQQLKKQRAYEQSFDTSYQFIEQYLINLIDFMRQYQGGTYVSRILSFLHKPRSHQFQTIIHNMSVVTEGSQHDDLQNSFKLPLYKYIELDEQIIDSELIEAFNQTFPKLRDLGVQNELQECFVKMVVQCMNEALNSLRPTHYIFRETQLSTLYALKNMEKVPLFECQNTSEQEMQYQFMLAQTLNKIFYWNKLQWGKVISLRPEQEGDRYEQMKQILHKQQDMALVQICAREEWHWYQEMVQIISQLTEELFVAILFEEVIEIAWNTGGRRNAARQPQIGLAVPDSSSFFQA